MVGGHLDIRQVDTANPQVTGRETNKVTVGEIGPGNWPHGARNLREVRTG